MSRTRRVMSGRRRPRCYRIDAAIVRRALGGDVDVPKVTRNVECEDRWCHD